MTRAIHSIDRRNFLQATAAVSAAGLLAARASADDKKSKEAGMSYKKAVKIGMVQVDGPLRKKFEVLKELGFDGVELNAPTNTTVREVLAAKEATGLDVPGVVDSVHWNERLSDPSADIRQKGLDALKGALEFCKEIGGTSVLLVPAKVTPDANFQQCWDRSIAEIKKATPLAEKLGIDILIENVWNDFLVDPETMAKYIDACESDRVGAHFDVGNTVRYSPPHEWIPILGKRIKKLDIKDYKLQGEGGNLGAGFNVPLMEGSVDWPKVMAELKKIGYYGWGTAEIKGGNREYLADVAQRMDKIFAS